MFLIFIFLMISDSECSKICFLLLNHISICVRMNPHGNHTYSTAGKCRFSGMPRELHHLELGLQVVVSHPTCILGIKLQTYARIVLNLTSLQHQIEDFHVCFFLFMCTLHKYLQRSISLNNLFISGCSLSFFWKITLGIKLHTFNIHPL